MPPSHVIKQYYTKQIVSKIVFKKLLRVQVCTKVTGMSKVCLKSLAANVAECAMLHKQPIQQSTLCCTSSQYSRARYVAQYSRVRSVDAMLHSSGVE